jgi:hypothetical protein
MTLDPNRDQVAYAPIVLTPTRGEVEGLIASA